MDNRAELHHLTRYVYDRDVRLGPQLVRLKPAHSRTRVLSYSLRVSPEPRFLHWLQDAYGNVLARVVFPEAVRGFEVKVDLTADLTPYNPFDFLLEPSAETWPLLLPPALSADLAPYLSAGGTGLAYEAFAAALDRTAGRGTVDVLVGLTRAVQQAVAYTARLEMNTQSPEETLAKGSGSCRDSALLLVEVLRSFGFAARFVSGYLFQDEAELHAWAEAYLPGAGWIGLDATSGLLAAEGHLPLAAAPRPSGAAPVEGTVEPCEVTFVHQMSLKRRELPRGVQ